MPLDDIPLVLALSEAPAVTITAEAVLVVTSFAAEGGRALLVEFQHLLAEGHIERAQHRGSPVTQEPARDREPGGLRAASTVAVYSAEIRARTSLRSLSILVIRARTLAWVSGSSSPGAAFQYVTTFRISSRQKARSWSGGSWMPRRL